MRLHAVLMLFIAASLAVAANAQASKTCHIGPFRGAASAQGAVAQMTVTNTGASCSITNYGVSSDRQQPAFSGSITSAPAHGTASFASPQAMYTPEPGFAGDDDFSYEALAKGNSGQPVTLRVRVKVKVVAP